MSLFTNFEMYVGFKNKNVKVVRSYRDKDWPGNPGGTCTGQAMVWLQDMAGKLKKGKGLKEPLLNISDRSTAKHYNDLNDGSQTVLNNLSSETVSLLGQSTASELKKKIPWTGMYKILILASGGGNGHGVGAYFPWMGNVRFFDANLIDCEIPSAEFATIMAAWPKIYDNVDRYLWGWNAVYSIPAKNL